MSTKKKKFAYVFALILSFALGMLTMSGCAYFSQEKVAGTVSTVLEIAYVAGGATAVALEQLSGITEAYLTTQLERGFSTLDFYKSLHIGENYV